MKLDKEAIYFLDAVGPGASKYIKNTLNLNYPCY